MSPSLLPEAMNDTVRSSHRLMLVGALALVAAFVFTLPLSTPPASAQSSSGGGSSDACNDGDPTNDGPAVYYLDSDSAIACEDVESAFCVPAQDKGVVFDLATKGALDQCCSTFKAQYGFCPDSCEALEKDFCSLVCCPSDGSAGYFTWGQCDPGDTGMSQLSYDGGGNVDLSATCGVSSSSSSSSSSSLCGNGTLDNGGCNDPNGTCEECDDGNKTSGDGCDEYCNVESLYCCSDTTGEREEVDYQSVLDLAASPGVAGDILEGYYCAFVDPNLYSLSDSNLTTVDPSASCFCGDGVVEASLGEECDMGTDQDGNSKNTDANGCSYDCKALCGDGMTNEAAPVVDWGGTQLAQGLDDNGKAVTLYEQCDDGNWSNGDGCDEYCQREPIYYCYSQSGYRQEVPNDVRPEVDVGYECQENDPYLPDCYGTVTAGKYDSCACGNGTIDQGEDCDLTAPNNTLENGCDESCHYVCGNYVVDDAYVADAAGTDWVVDDNGDYVVEECDDGNYNNGDGCDEDCQEEPGLCCYPRNQWNNWGYFDYQYDSITGEKMTSSVCANAGGTYTEASSLSAGSDFYQVCKIPGICCPTNGSTPYEYYDDGYTQCYGKYVRPQDLAQGDSSGNPYDADSDGYYSSEEKSHICNENGICCLDLDFDTYYDTYDTGVNRDYCDSQIQYISYFIPQSAVGSSAPSEVCPIDGLCCYPDGSIYRSNRTDCESYYDYNLQDYASYVTFDDANTYADDEISSDEAIAACNDYGVCCYGTDDDESPYYDYSNNTYDEGVDRVYCDFWDGKFTPQAAVGSSSAADVCAVPGVCCVIDQYGYATPTREFEDYCYDDYYTFDRANTNGDYDLSSEEMYAVCQGNGLCCIDLDNNQTFDTYRDNISSSECSATWGSPDNATFMPISQLPPDYSSRPSQYCPIAGVCCPDPQNGQSSSDPYSAYYYECYYGRFVSFDIANTNNDDELSPDEVSSACAAPGYCCNPLDLQTDLVYGADECETPEKFKPVTDLTQTWDEVCAQYCCYAEYDQDGFITYTEASNLAVDYPDVYAQEGEDCQQVTGDDSLLGNVQASSEDICKFYCCLDDGVSEPSAYSGSSQDPIDPNVTCDSQSNPDLTGGDEYGWPSPTGDKVCKKPVLCCDNYGTIHKYDKDVVPGDSCLKFNDDAGNCGTDQEDHSLCYEDMGAVDASLYADDEWSSAPICTSYCCDYFGDPYPSTELDMNTPCEEQQDSNNADLWGGENGYPTHDKEKACPTEKSFCCSGGKDVVEAVDANGDPLTSGGMPIKPGDDCSEFGDYNPFPAQDEANQSNACKFFCCNIDPDTGGNQVEISKGDLEAMGYSSGDSYPSCTEVADFFDESYADKPMDLPYTCPAYDLFGCETGPTGTIVMCYGRYKDDSGNVVTGDTGDCEPTNSNRVYSPSGLTCCEGNEDACDSPTFCQPLSVSIFGISILDDAICNRAACLGAGCVPDVPSGWLSFTVYKLGDMLGNPWGADAVACNVCNSQPNTTSDTVYICNGYGGYDKIDPADMTGDETFFTDAGEASKWCQLVYADSECLFQYTLIDMYGYEYFTDLYCSSQL